MVNTHCPQQGPARATSLGHPLRVWLPVCGENSVDDELDIGTQLQGPADECVAGSQQHDPAAMTSCSCVYCSLDGQRVVMRSICAAKALHHRDINRRHIIRLETP